MTHVRKTRAYTLALSTHRNPSPRSSIRLPYAPSATSSFPDGPAPLHLHYHAPDLLLLGPVRNVPRLGVKDDIALRQEAVKDLVDA